MCKDVLYFLYISDYYRARAKTDQNRAPCHLPSPIKYGIIRPHFQREGP
jgi:hypothetical protein